MNNRSILLINKPLHWTSNDVVRKVKKVTKAKKVGHGGTLDPLATGLLILGINEGTKQMQQYLNGSKVYIAQIIFGFATNTYDLEGEKNLETQYIPSIEQIEKQLNKFKKEYLQSPPIFSAIKQNGKKLYEYARQNKEIIINPRLVYLHNFKIISFYENILTLEIEVSKGFYVRSLANDLGKLLNSAATLYSLKRTQINEFKLLDAIEVDDIYDYWN